MSDFIPNSFQVPNAYIDRLWHLLRPVEKDVLLYLFRRIYGFHGKTCDAVSVKQFTHGLVTKDGRRLDFGTGWGRPAVLRAIDSLAAYGLVKIVAPAVKHPPAARRAAVYAMQLDPALIDIAGLEARARDANERGKRQVAAANEQKEVMRFVERTSPCGSLDEPTTIKYDTSNREYNQITTQLSSSEYDVVGDPAEDPTFDFPSSLFDL